MHTHSYILYEFHDKRNPRPWRLQICGLYVKMNAYYQQVKTFRDFVVIIKRLNLNFFLLEL